MLLPSQDWLLGSSYFVYITVWMINNLVLPLTMPLAMSFVALIRVLFSDFAIHSFQPLN